MHPAEKKIGGNEGEILRDTRSRGEENWGAVRTQKKTGKQCDHGINAKPTVRNKVLRGPRFRVTPPRDWAPNRLSGRSGLHMRGLLGNTSCCERQRRRSTRPAAASVARLVFVDSLYWTKVRRMQQSFSSIETTLGKKLVLPNHLETSLHKLLFQWIFTLYHSYSQIILCDARRCYHTQTYMQYPT